MGNDYENIEEISDINFSKASKGNINQDIFVFVAGTKKQLSSGSSNAQIIQIPFLVKILFEENSDINRVSHIEDFPEYHQQSEYYQKYDRLVPSDGTLRVYSPKISIQSSISSSSSLLSLSDNQFNILLNFNVTGKYYAGGSLNSHLARGADLGGNANGESDLYNDVGLLSIDFENGLPYFFRRYEPMRNSDENPFVSYFLEDEISEIKSNSFFGKAQSGIVKKELPGGGFEYFYNWYLNSIFEKH